MSHYLSFSFDTIKKEYCSLLRDIFLTIITFGLWNLYVQIRQIRFLDKLEPDNGIPSIFFIIILSLLTFGLYFCYHEYRVAKKLHQALGENDQELVEVLCGLATFLGLWILTDLYQQYLINTFVETYESSIPELPTS